MQLSIIQEVATGASGGGLINTLIAVDFLTSKSKLLQTIKKR